MNEQKPSEQQYPYYFCAQHDIMYSFVYSKCPICYRIAERKAIKLNPFKVGDFVQGHYMANGAPALTIGHVIHVDGDVVILATNKFHFKQCERVE